MTDWDKLKENLINFIKSCDDPPTEEQSRVYDILVGELIAEGDRLQELEKKHYQYALDANKRLGNCKQKLGRIQKHIDAIPPWLVKNFRWEKRTGYDSWDMWKFSDWVHTAKEMLGE